MLASKNLSSAIVPFEYAQKHLVFVAFSADVFETCNPFFFGKRLKKGQIDLQRMNKLSKKIVRLFLWLLNPLFRLLKVNDCVLIGTIGILLMSQFFKSVIVF